MQQQPKNDPVIYILIAVIAVFAWLSYRYTVAIDKMLLDNDRPVQLYLPDNL